jgi:hypothetical protein
MLTYALEKKAAYEQQSLSGGDACSIRQHTSAYVSMLQHASVCLEEMLGIAGIGGCAAPDSIRQHTCSIRAAYVNIRHSLLTSSGLPAALLQIAYVSIRAAYVSICPHAALLAYEQRPAGCAAPDM